jgi:hypothetical protein
MVRTTKEAMAGGSCEVLSQVVRHHLAEKTSTFLFQVKRVRLSHQTLFSSSFFLLSVLYLCCLGSLLGGWAG